MLVWTPPCFGYVDHDTWSPLPLVYYLSTNLSITSQVEESRLLECPTGNQGGNMWMHATKSPAHIQQAIKHTTKGQSMVWL